MFGEVAGAKRQRMIVMFSPNGTIPDEFWPDQVGEEFSFKKILKPLEAFKDRTLVMRGISNKVSGDGDRQGVPAEVNTVMPHLRTASLNVCETRPASVW